MGSCIVHLHFLRGMSLQFSIIAVGMHFFMFYMRICAYFGVRFLPIGVEFVLGTKRTLKRNMIKWRNTYRFKKCREEIASALNDFGNRWCKREYVEPDALKEWKVSIFKIVDQRIKFYSQNTNLLPPKIHFPTFKAGYPELSKKVCFGSSRQGRK